MTKGNWYDVFRASIYSTHAGLLVLEGYALGYLIFDVSNDEMVPFIVAYTLISMLFVAVGLRKYEVKAEEEENQRLPKAKLLTKRGFW